jgi:hypothetical protein
MIKNASFKDMCVHIVKAELLTKKDGSLLTWEDVFNYSSTGELFMIFEWYNDAVILLGETFNGESGIQYFKEKSAIKDHPNVMMGWWIQAMEMQYCG